MVALGILDFKTPCADEHDYQVERIYSCFDGATWELTCSLLDMVVRKCTGGIFFLYVDGMVIRDEKTKGVGMGFLSLYRAPAFFFRRRPNGGYMYMEGKAEAEIDDCCSWDE